MTITNGYATSAQFLAFHLPNGGTSSGDDAVIEGIIEAASRVIDCETERTFYARSETKYYDTPDGDELFIDDDDLLSVVKITNGDGTEITAGDYVLRPNNGSPKYSVKIKGSSTVTFEFDASGNSEKAISISGSWGYSSTAPKDIYQATLEIAATMYKRRYGDNMTADSTITADGVVISPRDIPASANSIIKKYRRFS